MTKAKAEEKTAVESQVGPASEQLGNEAQAPALEPTVPRAFPQSQKFSIPDEHKAPLEALAVVEEEWQIRLSCANTRRRKAMDVGDAEAAIVETRHCHNMGAARDEARKDVEKAIRVAIPEIPDGGRLHMIIPDYEVHYTPDLEG